MQQQAEQREVGEEQLGGVGGGEAVGQAGQGHVAVLPGRAVAVLRLAAGRGAEHGELLVEGRERLLQRGEEQRADEREGGWPA